MRVHFCLMLAFPAQGFFSNGAIRSAFKTVTAAKGVVWPEVLPSVRKKKLQDCPHFDESVRFPEYYRRDFHAYDGGNLNPVAAVEAMATTEGILSFYAPDKTGSEANEHVRQEFAMHTRRQCEMRASTFQPDTVADLGCGVGVSTNFLAKSFPSAKAVYGLDLSPFFLDYAVRTNPIVYIHRDAADTRFFDSSVTLVSISNVLHELPLHATKDVLRECHRILKPGGVLAVLDMHPSIPSSGDILQRILDRTEPYMNEYSHFCSFRNDVLWDCGFEIPRTVDDQHTTMLFTNKRSS